MASCCRQCPVAGAGLAELQKHQIRLNNADQPICGISRLSEIHNRGFAALELKKPTKPQQLSLL